MNKEFWKQTVARSMSGFVVLAFAIILYFVIQRFSEIRGLLGWIGDILMPFVYGCVFAYLLKSPCNFFEMHIRRLLPERYKKRAGGLSVLLVIVLALTVVYLLLAAVLPEVVDSAIKIVVDLPGQIDRFTTWILSKVDSDEVMYEYVNTVITKGGESVNLWLEQDLGPMLEKTLAGFAATMTSILRLFYNLLIGVVVCVYMLCSRKTFFRQANQLLYAALKRERADALIKEIRSADRIFTGFFVGKILDSTIIGLLCYVFCLGIGFAGIKFPNIMLISVVIGVTNIIPYFGPFVGAIPCALIIYISSPINCLIFCVFILFLQQFDGNYLGPKCLANSVGLSAFWVLFSITLFGGMFGFVGILAGVPVFAVIYDLIRRVVSSGLRRHGIIDIIDVMEENTETEK